MTTKAEDQSTMESKHDQFVKEFVDVYGVSSVAATIIWHIKQAIRLLHDDEHWASYRDFNRRDSWEIDYAFRNLASAVPPPDCTRAEKWERLFKEVLSREEGANSDEVEE